MSEGYIVTVEVFIPMRDVEISREGTLNTKKEIASILVEEVIEHQGFGYEIKNVRKVK